MRLQTLAVLIGLSLVVLSPLGSLGAAATEPALLSLSEPLYSPSDADASVQLLEPEAFGACARLDVLIAAPSVKQLAVADGSATIAVPEALPHDPGGLSPVLSLPAGRPVVVLAPKRYPVDD